MNLLGLEASAKTIRALSMDAVEKAQSGHPGLPMGCAEIGSFLFGEILNHYPDNPNWINRDRFVLSAGHGSMLLYSLLFMSGYELSLDDIKNFRQLKSKAPGHPEYHLTPGVETSTGPLGQGIANAVGMAIAGKRHGQRFNKEGYEIFNNRIFALVGDGDLMEGLSYEAGSIAGHLKLNNLIVIYDSNKTSIEGSTNVTFTEDVGKRFEAMNWHVIKIEGHDFADIKKGFDEAEKNRISNNKPVLIIANTIIGKGSPKKQSTNLCHGAPLGKEEIASCKMILNINEEFYVDKEAIKYFENKKAVLKSKYEEWQTKFNEWTKKFPELKELFDKNFSYKLPDNIFENLSNFKIGDSVPTRNSAHKVLNEICKDIDFIVSGSADLSSSTMTVIKDTGNITPTNFLAHNIQYGVREHAMGSIANGLYLFGGIKPIIGTFLSFVNYMKPAIRMAALMEIPIIYLFSHDSIYVGEDGPSHQPIEHLTELRMIPNVNVLRPADATETKTAWEIALNSKTTPTIIVTTRQKVPVLDFSLTNYKDGLKGAYIIKKESKSKIDLILIASGSEVSLALDSADLLEKEGISVRVVNMFSTFLFDNQDAQYKESILPSNIEKRIAIESGSSTMWYKYIGLKGDTVCIDEFGLSGKAEDLAKYFGFTKENVYQKAKALLVK